MHQSALKALWQTVGQVRELACPALVHNTKALAHDNSLPRQVCRDGVCGCRPGWTGSDCSTVEILGGAGNVCTASNATGITGNTTSAFYDAAGQCCSGPVDAGEPLMCVHGLGRLTQSEALSLVCVCALS